MAELRRVALILLVLAAAVAFMYAFGPEGLDPVEPNSEYP